MRGQVTGQAADFGRESSVHMILFLEEYAHAGTDGCLVGGSAFPPDVPGITENTELGIEPEFQPHTDVRLIPGIWKPAITAAAEGVRRKVDNVNWDAEENVADDMVNKNGRFAQLRSVHAEAKIAGEEVSPAHATAPAPVLDFGIRPGEEMSFRVIVFAKQIKLDLVRIEKVLAVVRLVRKPSIEPTIVRSCPSDDHHCRHRRRCH